MSFLKILGIFSLAFFASVLTTRTADAGDVPENRQVIDSIVQPSLDLENKVVYVDFWATWCPPCRRSFPWMKELSVKYREPGLRIVTVNLDERPTLAQKFLEDMGVSLPVVFDSSGTLARRYDLEVMPTSFIYGRDGSLRLRHEGFDPKDIPSLDSLVNALLREKPKE